VEDVQDHALRVLEPLDHEAVPARGPDEDDVLTLEDAVIDHLEDGSALRSDQPLVVPDLDVVGQFRGEGHVADRDLQGRVTRYLDGLAPALLDRLVHVLDEPSGLPVAFEVEDHPVEPVVLPDADVGDREDPWRARLLLPFGRRITRERFHPVSGVSGVVDIVPALVDVITVGIVRTIGVVVRGVRVILAITGIVIQGIVVHGGRVSGRVVVGGAARNEHETRHRRNRRQTQATVPTLDADTGSAGSHDHPSSLHGPSRDDVRSPDQRGPTSSRTIAGRRDAPTVAVPSTTGFATRDAADRRRTGQVAHGRPERPQGSGGTVGEMRDRMLRGELYLAGDPELRSANLRAQRLLDRYNAPGFADDRAARDALLRDLLGQVGERVTVLPTLRCDYGSHIAIGTGTFVNYGAVLLDVAAITVGADVQIATGVQLLTATHPVDPVVRRAGWESGAPITLGDNVWLGGGVIVCPGVTIGPDTVVGAGAVVVRDLPTGVVAVGNPARILRPITDDDRVTVPDSSA